MLFILTLTIVLLVFIQLKGVIKFHTVYKETAVLYKVTGSTMLLSSTLASTNKIHKHKHNHTHSVNTNKADVKSRDRSRGDNPMSIVHF